jgi:glycosyltransferase involved in cell wall biosynthesis
MNNKSLILLGIRGIPAQHGGFETFAEYLCHHLLKSDWKVTVYCQEDGKGKIYTSEWEGVNRIHIPVSVSGPIGTIIFDLKSVIHSLRQNGVFLTLGYNTAIFNILHRLFGKPNIINMDGIEWKRQKWSRTGKAWFWLNERFGCWFGNHLVADHPRIVDHLATRVSRNKITMIPYGGRAIFAPSGDVLEKQDFKDDKYSMVVNNSDVLLDYGLEEGKYGIVVARAEPENSILEIVSAFSKTKRDEKLFVVGNYSTETNNYHKAVMDAASGDVIFPGAIYDVEKLGTLRFHARFYVHGHQVGGTNPSLVEALAASNPVLAHDNEYNRWVAENGAVYFHDIQSASDHMDSLFNDDELVESLKLESTLNFFANFHWNGILHEYEKLLLEWLSKK